LRAFYSFGAYQEPAQLIIASYSSSNFVIFSLRSYTIAGVIGFVGSMMKFSVAFGFSN